MHKLALTFISICVVTVGTSFSVKASEADPTAHPTGQCITPDRLSATVQKLGAPLSDPELHQVKELLFGNAKKSLQCRRRVVKALMKAMDQPNLDLLWGKGTYDTWTYGALLLGEMKATEAINLLIAHLDATDGLSPNMNHYPAVEGLITMGQIAFPKLDRFLHHSPDRLKRRFATFCIAAIGGRAARHVLETALLSESDDCNRQFMTASIKAFKNQHSPNRIIFDPERSQWYSAFYCAGK